MTTSQKQMALIWLSLATLALMLVASYSGKL